MRIVEEETCWPSKARFCRWSGYLTWWRLGSSSHRVEGLLTRVTVGVGMATNTRDLIAFPSEKASLFLRNYEKLIGWADAGRCGVWSSDSVERYPCRFRRLVWSMKLDIRTFYSQPILTKLEQHIVSMISLWLCWPSYSGFSYQSCIQCIMIVHPCPVSIPTSNQTRSSPHKIPECVWYTHPVRL